MISMQVEDPTADGVRIILVTTPSGNVRIVLSEEGVVAHIEDMNGSKIASAWASQSEIFEIVN